MEELKICCTDYIKLMYEKINKKIDFKSKDNLIIFSIVLLRFFGDFASILSFFLLAYFVSIGTKQAIKGLCLCFLLLNANTAFFPISYYVVYLRYLVFLVAGITLVFKGIKSEKFNSYPIYLTFLIAALFILHSVFFSKSIELSILKITIWAFIFTSLQVGWSRLNLIDQIEMERWIKNFLISIGILSLLTLISPIGSYSHNQMSYQGILTHPQLFGLVCSVSIVFIIYYYKENKPIKFISLSLFFYLIFLSQSRTALLSLVPLILIIFSRKYIYILLILITIISFLIFWDNNFINKFINNFLIKHEKNDISNLFDIYINSRMILIEPMLNNIKNNPLGIGFGIPSKFEESNYDAVKLFNIPIYFPTEKGNLYLSIFEEVGLVCFIIFIIWLLCLLIISYKNSFFGLLIFLVILLSNFGEATFFAMGGFGLFSSIFITYVISKKKL